MIAISVPGLGELRLSELVLDFNGTLACDGVLLPGVREALAGLSADLRIHVVTADTHGSAARELEGLPVSIEVLSADDQTAAKRAFAERLGPEGVVAVGNGRNDRALLEVARVGVAVVQVEGAAPASIASADVVVPTILDALALLRHPRRLVATLRE